MKYWSKCVYECTVCIPFCEKHQSNFQTSAYSKYCALLRIHQEGNVNTLRPRQDGRHFSDDVFKCIYFNENAWISIKILLKFCSQDSNDGLVNWCIYASLGLNELNASGSSHYCHRTIFFLKWILPVWVDSDGLAQNLGNSGADRCCRGLAQRLSCMILCAERVCMILVCLSVLFISVGQ